MVAALVIPWRQVLALVVQATIVNNRLILINALFCLRAAASSVIPSYSVARD